jgi:predicted LPLAT superfamily acyltransferase
MEHTTAECGMTSSPDRRPNPGLHPLDSLFMIVRAIRLRKDHHKRSQRLPTVEPLQPEVSVLLHRLQGSLSRFGRLPDDRLCSRGQSVNRADVAFNQTASLSLSVSAGATSLRFPSFLPCFEEIRELR